MRKPTNPPDRSLPVADLPAGTDPVLGHRVDAALRLTGITIAEQDASLRYVWATETSPALALGSIVGRSDEELFPPEVAATLTAAKREVLATAQPRRLVVRTPANTHDMWFEVAIEPVRAADGTVKGVTIAGLDITERKRAEDHLRVLLLELAHRSKNLLAVIQGIANRTANDASSVDDFASRFSGRLHSLARAHDLLTERDWRGADLGALVRGQVMAIPAVLRERISASGDSFHIRPGAAQHVGLGLHELVVNAMAHGALSVASGRVSVTWRRLPPDANGIAAELVWRETGGPPILVPSPRQFGRVLLEEIVPAAVGGQAMLAFDPPGLVYTLRIGMSELGIL